MPRTWNSVKTTDAHSQKFLLPENFSFSEKIQRWRLNVDPFPDTPDWSMRQLRMFCIFILVSSAKCWWNSVSIPAFIACCISSARFCRWVMFSRFSFWRRVFSLSKLANLSYSRRSESVWRFSCSIPGCTGYQAS